MYGGEYDLEEIYDWPEDRIDFHLANTRAVDHIDNLREQRAHDKEHGDLAGQRERPEGVDPEVWDEVTRKTKGGDKKAINERYLREHT